MLRFRTSTICALGLVVSLALPAAASADIVVADQERFRRHRWADPCRSGDGCAHDGVREREPTRRAGFVDPTDVVLAPNGDMLVVDPAAFAGAGGGVIRVNPLTGARTTVSENASPSGGPSFVDPFGIALAANGDILIADQNAFGGGGGVIRVNPVTGARTTVSENASPAGGPAFEAPWGIIELANGDIVVADAGAFGGGGGLIRVNPATGARTILSANWLPSGGPRFSDPIQLRLAANGDILVTDSSAFTGGGVIRVDPATGARTLVSENSSPPGDPAFTGTVGIASGAERRHPGYGPTNVDPGGAVTR